MNVCIWVWYVYAYDYVYVYEWMSIVCVHLCVCEREMSFTETMMVVPFHYIQVLVTLDAVKEAFKNKYLLI